MPGRSSTAGGGREINSHLEAWTKSVAKALSHPTRMGILERMEKVGQTKAALSYYAQIVKEYPQSQEAKAAKKRISLCGLRVFRGQV